MWVKDGNIKVKLGGMREMMKVGFQRKEGRKEDGEECKEWSDGEKSQW